MFGFSMYLLHGTTHKKENRMSSPEELIENPSFKRFINDNASEEEVRFWTQWIHADSRNYELYQEAQFLLKGFNIKAHTETNDEEDWLKLQSRLEQDDLKNKYEPVSFLNTTTMYTLRYAAIVLLAILIGVGIWVSGTYKEDKKNIAQNIVVQTQYRETQKLHLSDGSQIFLAPNSKITYKSNWLKKPVKKLKLSGQAYFDIAGGPRSDGKAKFEIHTSQGIIRDFGTKFNVSTFGNRTTVVLEDGEVSVSKNENTEVKQSIKLEPGHMAVLDSQSPTIKTSKVNPRVYTSWTGKTLYFDNTPLSFFLSYIKNNYGKPVVVRDSTLLNRRLNNGIDRGSVPDMLAVFSKVLDIKLYQENDTVYVGQKNLNANNKHN